MKTIHTFACIILLAFTLNSYAQPGKISWEKQSQIVGLDFYTDIIEDKNEGYTVIGSKNTKGQSLDYWLLRYTTNGDTIWTKTLGTAQKDIPKKITQLSDKSYVLLGTTQTNSTTKVFMARVDSNGNELWRKVYEPAEIHMAEDIIALEENKFAIAGAKGADPEQIHVWMAVMDENAQIEWEKTFQESLKGCARSIKKLPDSGFALAAQVSKDCNKDCDIMAIRTNEKGTAKWFSWVKTPNQQTWPECICCSMDSCFMVVGWKGKCLGDINANDAIFDFDMVLNKINCDGKILWTKSFDREGSEGGDAVTIRPDGNFIVAGIKLTSFLGKVGPWLLHVDAEGNEINEQLLKFRFNNDHAAKIINCSDGGFVVIGPGVQEDENSRSDGWIVKFAGM